MPREDAQLELGEPSQVKSKSTNQQAEIQAGGPRPKLIELRELCLGGGVASVKDVDNNELLIRR